ncbi:MAG: hypothetical protein LC799_05905, partial [Actinobacteria bacterium]|nr:hypothetical protein [Actinomycetota bacterium]
RFVGMGTWPTGMQLVGVANKIGSPEDEAYVESGLASLGVPLWATIPLDPSVKHCERKGDPLVTLDRGSAARRAVAGLADRLQQAARAGEPVSSGPRS